MRIKTDQLTVRIEKEIRDQLNETAKLYPLSLESTLLREAIKIGLKQLAAERTK
jgi:hypothetical protein